MAEYSKDEIKRIEQKWQQKWEKEGVYRVQTDHSKPKYYVLDMFPYPSGAGLHVGHPLGYIASDIVSRFKRLKGFNVLHPMGFDAFGLPAEQYAIQTGQHPAITTAKNIETYKRQLRQIGFSYDWSREVQTCDPKYYKWTQWIFMQLFNAWYNNKAGESGKTEPIQTLIAELEQAGNASINAACDEDTPVITAEQWKAFNEKEKEEFLQHYRIAYQSETMVNWCAALGTVLSNDEVKDGVSERGGYPVERIKMLQWSMRISAYAERLLTGLDTIDWPEPLKEMQRNWIGRSRGCELEFSLTPNPSPKEGTGPNQRRGFETSEKKYWHILKERSKEHRKNPTLEEKILWGELRNGKLGHKIRRQHAIGFFIADFVCLDKRLVIEVDGEYHNNNVEYDEARTSFLNHEGFNVIRFTNNEVKNDLSSVLSQIKSALDTAPSIKHTSPSPAERGTEGEALTIKVFTTRIDTIFGATFIVLAPEHELVDQLTIESQREEVTKYIDVAKNRSERERMSEVKRVSGVFTGAYAVNPFNNERIQIWIADYVLAGYGTGAVMAVPGHDERDHRFAKHYNLPIVQVVEGPDVQEAAFDSWDANIINSGFMNGMTVEEAIEAGIKFVEERGIGKGKVNYRMRDAIFGRQRYWGEPFPVYFEDGIPKLVAENDLPVTLPEIDEYKPTETGDPPLARAKDWKYNGHNFELTTMPGWAGSSWYWFRYMDPHNDQEFCAREHEQYWKDVDLYLGGSEHATGHLLYSRFWCKALKDLGFVGAEEPFKKLINQGHIQGVSKFAYRCVPSIFSMKPATSEAPTLDVNRVPPLFISSNIAIRFMNNESTEKDLSALNKFRQEVTNDIIRQGESGEVHIMLLQKLNVEISLYDENNGLDIESFKKWRDEFNEARFLLEEGKFICPSEVEKMSKSKFNVVNPDDIIANYGADTLRMYEMFLGPLEMSKPWNTNGIDGVFKFLRRFWNLFHDASGNFKVSDDEPTREELKVLHKTIKKIEQDINNFSFNTSVSEFMICANELNALKCSKRKILEPLVIALSPFAPHVAEELWEKLGHTDTILKAGFPVYNEEYLKESLFEYPISINGKVRTKMEFALDMPKEDIEKLVLASETVAKWTEGKPPKKVIVVPGKIVNVVI
jgi:leucyl-tRNA synthetase